MYLGVDVGSNRSFSLPNKPLAWWSHQESVVCVFLLFLCVCARVKNSSWLCVYLALTVKCLIVFLPRHTNTHTHTVYTGTANV